MYTQTILDSMTLNLNNLKDTASRDRKTLHDILVGILKISRDARLNKNYELSDNIRNILKNSGINVIQGDNADSYDFL